jgi:hypothetical protein
MKHCDDCKYLSLCGFPPGVEIAERQCPASREHYTALSESFPHAWKAAVIRQREAEKEAEACGR